MRSGEERRRSERGFTYIGLLAVLMLIGILLAAAGDVAATTSQREREAQLLWVGHEYRVAIARFWNTRRAFPQTLAELLGGPPDSPLKIRFIRQLYLDPMTNSADWELVPAPNGGGIIGIASRSKREPLKIAGFDAVDKDFVEAKTYNDWKFTFLPAVARRR